MVRVLGPAILIHLLLALGAIGAPLHAQTTRGTITGTVTDETGGVVAGARINVREIDKGLTFETTTDSEGNYVVPGLFPGRYRVEAENPGFQKTIVEPLQLHVDQRLAANFTLKLGEVSQQVEVTSQGELVQTGSSSIGQVVGTQMVVDLPLNGRNFLQLGLLSPGTTTTPQGSDAGGRGSISISGSRTASNQFSIDGMFNGATAFNDLNVQLSVDAIQEFKIQRNTFSAEFGYGAGQVNVATKSGSNSIHGSVYEFLRNDVLDARQFFDESIPPFRQNQFGFSVGGPIRKDRTFFFVNYEGFRWRRQITLIGTLPSARELSGDFSGLAPVRDPLTGAPFPDNRIPQNRFSPLSQRILAFLPRPAAGGANNYITSPGFSQDWDQTTFRIDHRLSVKDNLLGRYTYYQNLDSYSPGLTPSSGLTNTNAPHNATVQWTRSFSPSMLNELRAGFNREFFVSEQDGANGPDILQFQNIVSDPVNHGLPFVALLGYTGFGPSLTVPQIRGSNVYQYGDQLTWIQGRHTLKLGGGFRNLQQPHVPIVFGRGQFVFQGLATGNPVADFLLGNPFVSVGAGKRPISYMSFHYYDGFVQDDWKIAPSLTLNFGVRYERVGVVTDRYRGRLGVFNEATGQVATGDAVDQQGLVNPDNLGFQPRFGFAWQPFSEPHTVIRGGYGIYNDVKVINERNFSLGTELGWQQIVDAAPLAGLPPSVNWDTLFPLAPAGSGLGILTDDPFSRDPYIQMWSLGLQREFPFDAVLEVAYVGQVGHKLTTRLDINQARLPAFPNEPLAPRRPYPAQGNVLMSKDVANSNYNALQVRLEKRYSHNLSFLSAYTFSKSLDNASSTCDISSCNSAQNNRNLRAEYGPSSFDQRHRLVLSPIYLFPFGKGQKYGANLPGALNALVKGWQLSTIMTLASGTPFPVQVNGGDRTLTGTFGGGKQYANCIGEGMLPSSQRTVERDFNTSAFEVAPLGTYGNCGRDVLTSRGTNNWDIAFLKDTQVSERATLQFRTEFFNAWNHTQFGIPIFDPTSQAFGRITSVKPAREIQFAVKLLF